MEVVIYSLFIILALLMLSFVVFVLYRHKINSIQIKNVPRDDDDFGTILSNNSELLSSCYAKNNNTEYEGRDRIQEGKE
ncbi:MAG: hypothetical protein J1G01_04595 [Clostridiales bacterium]|nr:hypothetical protein [Clostridiales bacterium]